MKMKIHHWILGVVLLVAAAGCSYEGLDLEPHYSDIGTVTMVGNEGTPYLFAMRRDDGAELIAVSGLNNNVPVLEEGQRIYCIYDLAPYDSLGADMVKSDTKRYYISVVGFDRILTKKIVKESYLASEAGEGQREAIGDDKIEIYQASIGDNHINVEFQYDRGKHSTDKHLITLVWDDMASDENTVYLRLYHNAYEDTFENNEMFTAYGLASFPIAEIMPDGKNEVMIKISPAVAGEYIEMSFRLGKPTNPYSGKPSIGENLVIAPMDSIEYTK